MTELRITDEAQLSEAMKAKRINESAPLALVTDE